MIEMISKSSKETQKIAAILAKEIVRGKITHAVVLALTGNLGAGKTTFVQGFAASLGIKEKPTSPTFVIMKAYAIMRGAFSRLVHVDAYRLKSGKDLESLGVRNILRDPHAIMVIEWAERVRTLLPRDVVWLKFRHGKRPNERTLNLKIKM